MNRLTLVCLMVVSTLFSLSPIAIAQPHIQEIHSKHFKFGYPLGAPETNDLIFQDIYVLSSNDTTKFADWVCYKLTPVETMSGNQLNRNYKTEDQNRWGDSLFQNELLNQKVCGNRH